MHRSLRIGSGGVLDSNSINALRPYDGKIAGLYDLEETLGRGHYAVVKLARHVFTGEKVAVKVIDKSKLDEVSKAHLFQEVRCMKLVQHPNVVRLYEVIDTATKLYLILELGDGGDLYDYIMRHDTGLSEQLAKEYFRQIVRAISYCHELHVVHRDLKPENVVFFEKLGVVKLTDFGFSNKFCPGQKLETSCGSLAYSAPEILLGDSYDAPAVDVWSLGVILYMLVCGQAPFQEANDSETLTMIMDCKYNVPAHVSKECQDLIARMLVKNPEKRASLNEISNHPWLTIDKQECTFDVLPLVSREQLSEEDHNFIVTKIVNGKIATKDEIQECLDKNEYNHITATYYLLAERKLRSKRQDLNKNKRPEHLAVPTNKLTTSNNNNSNNTDKKTDGINNSILPAPCLLTVPRTPGDLPQRTRKCSIVQEDEEEEDISASISGREELSTPLNRRGSKSEDRLYLALQDRLAEKRRKPPPPPPPSSIAVTTTQEKIKSNNIKENLDKTPTLILTESSTISIPIITTTPCLQPIQKYKTMPPSSPTKSVQLNEIFEEDTNNTNQRQFGNRTTYEQRRTKFHKTRTASCSSSDASDDDSEKRKKRQHKLNNTQTKQFQSGRRDSHDDSSDSQEPGTGTSTSRNTQTKVENTQKGDNTNNSNNSGNGGNGNNGGKKNTVRQHKMRRRNGETRLRESQSLNRITEEDGIHNSLIITTAVVGIQNVLQTATVATAAAAAAKNKTIGARLLHSFKKTLDNEKMNQELAPTVAAHISRKDTLKLSNRNDELLRFDKGQGLKKMRLLSKYFQMHKKLCIPLPNLFNRNQERLYKTQSCSSLNRCDKIQLTNENLLKLPQKELEKRAVSVLRNSQGKTIQLNNVCNDLCAIHLEQASKCCSFC